jgi:hypothetical protein
MRLQFDLGQNTILDAAVTQAWDNKIELYVLTAQWVAKVKIYELLDTLISQPAKPNTVWTWN